MAGTGHVLAAGRPPRALGGAASLEQLGIVIAAPGGVHGTPVVVPGQPVPVRHDGDPPPPLMTDLAALLVRAGVIVVTVGGVHDADAAGGHLAGPVRPTRYRT